MKCDAVCNLSFETLQLGGHMCLKCAVKNCPISYVLLHRKTPFHAGDFLIHHLFFKLILQNVIENAFIGAKLFL